MTASAGSAWSAHDAEVSTDEETARAARIEQARWKVSVAELRVQVAIADLTDAKAALFAVLEKE